LAILDQGLDLAAGTSRFVVLLLGILGWSV
jgi:hypothetical protein